jgi:hypothetical protein
VVSREEYLGSGKVSDLPWEVGVYTQGKVGSKAILATLRKMFAADEDVYVWDFRRTSLEGVRQHDSIRGLRRRLLVDEPEIAEFMEAHPDRDMRLTSIVRDPVAINLSSFFYNFGPRNPGLDIRDISDREIIERLVAGEAFSSPSYHLDWFDIEVNPQTGIDVYSGNCFPIDSGFEVYAGKRGMRQTDLLVFRIEDLANVGVSALARFYDRSEHVIFRKNTADEQPYGVRYTQFLRGSRLPAEWIAWQLNSRYARFFYSDAERIEFAKRWSGSSEDIR